MISIPVHPLAGVGNVIYDLNKYLVPAEYYSPNWFAKHHFEEWLQVSLTQNQFEAMCDDLDDSGIPDQIADMVRSHVEQSSEEMWSAKKGDD